MADRINLSSSADTGVSTGSKLQPTQACLTLQTTSFGLGATLNQAEAASLQLPRTAPVIDRSSLDHSLVHGMTWTGSAKWFVQILNWASTLIVARLLTPDDYGLVGMAAIYMGLAAMLNEFGLGAAIVTKSQMTADQIAQFNTVSVLLGIAIFAVSCGAATPLAAFFEAPNLRNVVIVMSFAFIVTSFRTVPYSLLERERRFRLLAVMDGAQALAQSASILLLAFLGFGYWALVLGGLLGAVVSTAVTLSWRRHRFASPRWGSLNEAITFSGHVLVGRLTFFVYSNADFLVAGRLLGKSALGVYTIAFTLASMPMDKITALITRVTPAIYSAVQEHTGELRRYLLILSEALSMVTIPIAWGMALVSDEFVSLALGSKWAEATTPLRILAIYAGFRSIQPLLGPVLNATGQARLAMNNGILSAVILPISFLIGSNWGLAGIALAWMLVHPMLTLRLYWLVFRKLQLTTPEYIASLRPALTAAFAMTIAVLGIKFALPKGLTLSLKFGMTVSAGAAVYILVLVTFYRKRLHSIYKLFSRVTTA